ncbi:MAG: HlyD family efflux transporter periplasmic adaptor subunit [Phycisphaerae bacterium]|nr:HlyD family efflux transporter periplasmic adaptor subunit [Phycisphaerae bacterium]
MTKSQTDETKEKVEAQENKPKPKRTKFYLTIFLGIPLAVLVILYLIPATFYIPGYGYILSAGDASLRAGSKGPIRAVLARSGQFVKEGDVIIELEDDVEQAEVERCKRELSRAKAELKLLEETNRLEIIQDKLAIESAKIQYEDSKNEVMRVEKLRDSNAVSDLELRIATTKREMDRIQLQERMIEKNDLRTAQIEIKKREIDTINAQLISAQRMLARRKIPAPMTGVLIMHSLSIGQVVDANEVLGQIFDNSYHQIVAHIPEKYGSFLSKDQRLLVELSSYPWWNFGYLSAQLYWVAPVVNPQASGDGTVQVKAKLEKLTNGSIDLKAGMSAKIWIVGCRTSLLAKILGVNPYGKANAIRNTTEHATR